MRLTLLCSTLQQDSKWSSGLNFQHNMLHASLHSFSTRLSAPSADGSRTVISFQFGRIGLLPLSSVLTFLTVYLVQTVPASVSFDHGTRSKVSSVSKKRWLFISIAVCDAGKV